MFGEDGNDTLSSGTGGGEVFGGTGNDSLAGGLGKDALYGGDGADTLSGGAGNDSLIGGAGSDVLTGGAGADVFYFAAGDSTKVVSTIDRITDFTTGTDKLAVGVTATAANALLGQSATSFAAALSQATSLISGGTRDIVVTTVSGVDAGTYVFVDSGATNTVNLAIKLNTVANMGLGDFI